MRRAPVTLAEALDPDRSLWEWLAVDVRRYRKAAGMSQPALGKVMGCPRQNVNNIESGQRGPTEEHCQRLDAHFETGGHFGRLLRFARLAKNPDWYLQYTEYEAEAGTIWLFDTLLIPAIFQTPDYARALLAEGHDPDVDGSVAKRMARREVLTKRNAPDIWSVLDEGVLYHEVGGKEVMQAQLQFLLELSRLRNVSVRVVSFSAGEYSGLNGPFRRIATADEEVVFAEAPHGGGCMRDPSDVKSFDRRFHRIGAKALPEEDSRKLITKALESMQ
jgi:transcriptional regulator with XRE-family HTH domain